MRDKTRYEEMNVNELRERAQELRIAGASSMKKEELIEALRTGKGVGQSHPHHHDKTDVGKR